jgi:antitoxin component YwqK of YwqJK toxin-antitoxin module
VEPLYLTTVIANKSALLGFLLDGFPVYGPEENGVVIDNAKDTMLVASYLNGLEEGIQKKWYPNQQIALVRNYHAGKKVGKHLGYWENGQPQFKFYFLDGEYHGEAKEWYQNGQVYRTFHYEHGYEQGSQKMWWENGIIRANYVVKNGRRYGLIGLKLCMNPNDTILKKTK